MDHIESNLYSFRQRLLFQEARRVRQTAEKLKRGPDHDALLRKARNLEVAAEWISFPDVWGIKKYRS
jgi:hypothetical protein